MQVQFCIKELKNDFPLVWAFLCSSHDMFLCVQRVCTEYEQPAVNNVGTRYSFAQEFYDEFVNEAPAPEPQPVTEKVNLTVAVIQFLMQFNDQSIWPYEIDGIKSKKFFDALREFTDAMEGC